MSSKSQLKLLVVGDVNGQFDQLFTRVSSVNKKAGPFDMLLCVGNFFGENCDSQYDSLIHGSLELPSIPIYILGPTEPSLEKYYKKSDESGDDENFNYGFEIVDGLIYLGKTGILTGESGIKIAYLSGREDIESQKSKCFFSEEDLKSLILSHQSQSSIIDILITNQWPKNVLKYSDGHTKGMEEHDENGSLLISQLVKEIKPRYHFTSSHESYYERNPYRNHQILAEATRHVTRFISIANVGNKTKAKWLYAFSISPANLMDKEELIKQPTDVTENPFLDMKISKPINTRINDEKAPQFFYDLNREIESKESYGRKRFQKNENVSNKKRSQPPQPKEPCWFCLASPDVEKHMIISIGEHTYLAMAKGGLTDDHLLILPIGHHRSTVELVDNQELNEEITKFKNALIQYFDSKNCCVVFFERNFKSSHLQIQVVPVNKSKAQDLKTIIQDFTEERALKFNELPENCELSEALNPGIPYFYIEVPNAKFFMRIKSGEYFPLQLGREILAHTLILNCQDKIDWKECALSKEQTTSIANRIRKEFEPFDFTL